MTNNPSQENEAYLASMLAKIDEAIANGDYAADDSLPDQESLDSMADDPRLQRAANVLKMLDAMRPDSEELVDELSKSSVRSDNAVDTQGANDAPTDADGLGAKSDDEAHQSPKSIGRFQIVRELGQGGFGVVFLANDPELRRQVAVKVPRPQALFSDDLRQRFLREGQAAAALNHANVVPVFEAGRDGAVVYLASAYCHGSDLSSWMKDRKSTLSESQIANWTRQIAEGIQHAHSRGILHRDLKPSNILLSASARQPQMSATEDTTPSKPETNRDSTLTPLVTDFGLAKQLDVTDESITEGILGTPNYMSPEQAAGDNDSIGVASDIYSLGAILYFMVAGRPPFESKSVLDVLNAVREHEPPRLKEFRDDVSPDLEAICMKCLEKDIGDRYDSASELADDLQRFLDGEPVRARAVSTGQRLVKWCKRNPVVASLASAVAVSLLIATVASVIGWIVSSQALERESTARIAAVGAQEEAEDARADADRRYEDAWNAVEDFFVKVSTNQLLNTPGMQPLRLELLNEAAAYYESFLNERSDDPDLQREVALAHLRVGLVKLELDQLDDANESFEESLVILETLIDEKGELEEFYLPLADALEGLGVIRLKRYEFAIAADYFGAALANAEKSEIDPEGAPTHCRIVMSVANNLGLATRRIGKTDEAKKSFEKAISIGAELCDAYPDDVDYRIKEMGARGNLAILYRNELGNPAETMRINAELESEQSELLEKFPNHPLLLESYAQTCANMGLPLFYTGKFDQALVWAEKSVNAFDRLAMMNPDVFQFRRRAASIVAVQATCYAAMSDFDNAKKLFRVAKTRLEELVEERDDIKELQLDLAGLLMNSSVMHSRLKEHDEARTNVIQALAMMTELRDENPEDFALNLGVAQTLQNMSQIESAAENYEAAVDQSTLAIEAFETMLSEYPDATEVRKGVIQNYTGRAISYEKMGRFDQALADRRRNLDLAEPERLANYELGIGLCLLRSGSDDGVEEYLEKYNETLPNHRVDRFLLARLECRYASAVKARIDEQDEPNPEDTAKVDQLLSQSMAHLLQARDMNVFRNPDQVRKLVEEEDFELISEEPEFVALLRSLGISTEPPTQ